MDATDALLDWAMARGVELSGIVPKRLAGRGFGIVATRPIKAGQVVLSIPSALLRSLGNTPKSIVRHLQGATVHAILAAAMCLDMTPDFGLWRAVLPSPAIMTHSMPLCWPTKLQQLLPPAAKASLVKQSANFERDWALVAAAYPDGSRVPGITQGPTISRDDFLYAWTLVNSRTFYHTTPRTESRLPKEDHMVLQPVADLFNHTPDCRVGCSVAFDSRGYTFSAVCSYKPGEELLICYGPHANDDLLVEYGFLLDLHPADCILLDPYLCPLFSPSQRELLRDTGFWKRYVHGCQEPCYRTLTALRLLCLSIDEWRAILRGSRDEDQDCRIVNTRLLNILLEVQNDAHGKIAQLLRTPIGTSTMRASLRWRWLQIKQLVTNNISRLEAQ